MAELTITRADLVEIATEALAASEGVTDEQKLEMCETAHKAPQILAGAWLTKQCGCLVGATYSRVLNPSANSYGAGGDEVREKLGGAVTRLGNKFDILLREKIGYQDVFAAPVRVID